MKQNVSKWTFHDAFRETDGDQQFTPNGLSALYDYIIEYEDDTGEETELDVIVLCCDFTEYKNLKEYQADYGSEHETLEAIQEVTTVIKVDSESFIIQDY